MYHTKAEERHIRDKVVTYVRGAASEGHQLYSVAFYPDWDELQREYPGLGKEHIRQALQFAAGNLYDRSIAIVRNKNAPQTKTHETRLPC